MSTSGKVTVASLWDYIKTGNISSPRIATIDYAGFTSGTIHYTYFVAQRTHLSTTITFRVGSTAQVTNTYTNVGIYTVASDGSLTLVASATAKALSGTYSTQTFTLTSSYTLVEGVEYAIGFLQVATTTATVTAGAFGGSQFGSAPLLAATGAAGLSTLPATATAPTAANGNPVYYEIT